MIGSPRSIVPRIWCHSLVVRAALAASAWAAAGCEAPPSTPSRIDAAVGGNDQELVALHGEDKVRREDAVAFLSSDTEALATGNPHWIDPPRHPWPVQLLSIGHSIASYQNYSGSPYFHHGLDMRAEAGSDVHASVGGKVVNIENYVPGDPAYWEIAILDADGYLWQYHHVEHGSIPRAIFDAYRSGTAIPDGAKLGEVYYWSALAFGERFHHIHVNVLGADRTYLNGFRFLEPLDDRSAPQFVEVGLLKNGRRLSGRNVSGTYGLFAIVHDLVLHPRFSVPPRELRARVDGGADQVVWRFDALPGGASNTRFVHDLYVPSLTCGDYNCRRLALNLGFVPDGSRSFPAQHGAHRVELTAIDDAGNASDSSFEWNVD